MDDQWGPPRADSETWGRLIDAGCGILSPSGESEDLKRQTGSVDHRHVTLFRTEAVIDRMGAKIGDPGQPSPISRASQWDPVCFGALCLSELALIRAFGSLTGLDLRLDRGFRRRLRRARRHSWSNEARLVRGFARAPSGPRGRPSHQQALRIISGLAYYLKVCDDRPHLEILTAIVEEAVSPLLPILRGQQAPDEAEPTTREPWRRLAEALTKHHARNPVGRARDRTVRSAAADYDALRRRALQSPANLRLPAID